jgi:4-hydroxy-tetrahydrodipicolinate reductase
VIRVGVIGARGRMGQIVCRAISEASDLALVAAIDRTGVGQEIGRLIGRAELDVPVSDELDRLLEAEVEVAVDFTHPNVVMDDVRWCIAHGIHVVVGTTGVSDRDLAEIGRLIDEEGGEPNVLVAPNFAIGAVLMQRFAALAARHFPAVEIIELHHAGKVDAPSGTALATARRIAEATGGLQGERESDAGAESIAGVRGGVLDGVRIHSVRLPGLVAHQEVVFGGEGQTLTVRHDSTDRTSFMPGVLLAVRRVSTRPGLTVGLEPLLDLP